MPEKKKEMENLAKLLLEKYGAKALDMDELEEVTGGMSANRENLESAYYWLLLVTIDPSLKGGQVFSDDWAKLDIEFKNSNEKNLYKDKVTGQELDFFGAWALALKRFDTRIGGVRTDKVNRAFEKIYMRLASLVPEGK